MIRKLLRAALVAALLAPLAPALAGDGNDAVTQTTAISIQLAAVQTSIDALTACLTYDPAARVGGNVPLPRGKNVVCPATTVTTLSTALSSAKTTAATANTTLATDLSGLGSSDATTQQGTIATQLTAIQGAITALQACVAYDPAARDGSGRIQLPGHSPPLSCPAATVSAQIAALTSAKSAASTAATAVLTDLAGLGFGGVGPSAIPAGREVAANWAKAGLLSVGGIPARATVCATLSPIGGGSNDVTAINSAIAACPAGQTVSLAAGSFTIAEGNYVVMNKGVTLRGAGAGTTILTRTGGAQTNCVDGGGNPVGCASAGANPSPMVLFGTTRFNNNHSTGTLLTADVAQGAYSVQVTDATGFAVGQLVQLDERSGASWQTDPEVSRTDPTNHVWGQVWASPDFRVVWNKHNPYVGTDDFNLSQDPTMANTAGCTYSDCDRPQNELKQVSAISGNTITFDSPVTISYRTSHQALLSYWTSSQVVSNAGIENLTLERGDNGNIQFYACMYCWAKNIESRIFLDPGIRFVNTFRNQLEGIYSHNAANPSPGGSAYAIALDWATSEALIENSISVLANKVIVARAAGAGSVIAYNYMDDAFIYYNLKWQEMGLNASHLAGPHHVLFEGNYSFNMDSDKTHGNSTNMTFFRNYASGYRSTFTDPISGATVDDSNNLPNAGSGPNGPIRTAGPAAQGYWFSFAGNVLGTSGHTSGWSYSGTDTSASNIFLPGWDDWNPNPYDPTVATSSFIDGNYDYVQSAVTWDASNSAHLLPNSRFLTAAPAFFSGSCSTWPWVAPTGATKLYTLPAKARYDAGTPNAIGSGC